MRSLTQRRVVEWSWHCNNKGTRVQLRARAVSDSLQGPQKKKAQLALVHRITAGLLELVLVNQRAPSVIMKSLAFHQLVLDEDHLRGEGGSPSCKSSVMQQHLERAEKSTHSCLFLLKEIENHMYHFPGVHWPIIIHLNTLPFLPPLILCIIFSSLFHLFHCCSTLHKIIKYSWEQQIESRFSNKWMP